MKLGTPALYSRLFIKKEVSKGLFWRFKFNMFFMSTLPSENMEFVRLQMDKRKTQSPDIASQQGPYLQLFPELVRQRRYVTMLLATARKQRVR